MNTSTSHCPVPALSPPGDCKPSQHRWLQNEVNRNCKVERSCEQKQDCATLFKNLAQNFKCGDARKEINNTCFRGGDNVHRKAVLDAANAAAKCQGIINQKKCKPLQQPQVQPELVPVNDESFMEHMARITGLTGGALILYLLISEGSRLFPPRNAIPIP